MQLHQFELGAFAQLLVERGQRLVKQQHPRPARQRAGQRHALLLATGKLVGLTLLEPIELQEPHHVRHARLDLQARHRHALQAEGDVVARRKMGKKSIVLEHHVHGTLMRQNTRDIVAVEQDTAFVRRLESREHPQQRGLAATARTKQSEKFAGSDVQTQPVHCPQCAKLFHHRIDAQQRNVRRFFCLRWVVRHIPRQPGRDCTLAADRHRLKGAKRQTRSGRDQI